MGFLGTIVVLDVEVDVEVEQSDDPSLVITCDESKATVASLGESHAQATLEWAQHYMSQLTIASSTREASLRLRVRNEDMDQPQIQRPDKGSIPISIKDAQVKTKIATPSEVDRAASPTAANDHLTYRDLTVEDEGAVLEYDVSAKTTSQKEKNTAFVLKYNKIINSSNAQKDRVVPIKLGRANPVSLPRAMSPLLDACTNKYAELQSSQAHWHAQNREPPRRRVLPHGFGKRSSRTETRTIILTPDFFTMWQYKPPLHT